jgi:hypothetical protein
MQPAHPCAGEKKQKTRRSMGGLVAQITKMAASTGRFRTAINAAP